MKVSRSAVRLRPVRLRPIPEIEEIPIVTSTRPVPWTDEIPPDAVRITGKKIYRRYAVMPPRIHELGSQRIRLEDRDRIFEFFGQLLREPGGLKARALDEALRGDKPAPRRLPAASAAAQRPAPTSSIQSEADLMPLEAII